jgi:hypothetical protein
LSPEAKWRLAAAYQMAGHQLLHRIGKRVIHQFPSTHNAGISYGSTKGHAMVLETLTLMGNRKGGVDAARIASGLAESWYKHDNKLIHCWRLLHTAVVIHQDKKYGNLTINGKVVKISSASI